ncbi:hypothetical protein B0H19DRAFT_1095760 [Mycena capillaripes]|nr:hypothetical protein B0H19DRAFT_1095760 [Mycena capillaripes]
MGQCKTTFVLGTSWASQRSLRIKDKKVEAFSSHHFRVFLAFLLIFPLHSRSTSCSRFSRPSPQASSSSQSTLPQRKTVADCPTSSLVSSTAPSLLSLRVAVMCASHIPTQHPPRSPCRNSQDTACICASAVYATNVTACATSACNFSAADVQSELTSNCATESGSASSSASGVIPPPSAPPTSNSATISNSNSNSGPTPPPSASPSGPSNSASNSGAKSSGSNSAADSSQSGAPNSAEFNGARIGATAASAIGLVFYALLV